MSKYFNIEIKDPFLLTIIITLLVLHIYVCVSTPVSKVLRFMSHLQAGGLANEDWDPCKRTCRTSYLLFSLWFAFMVVHVWKHGKGLLRLLNSSSLRPTIHSVLQVKG